MAGFGLGGKPPLGPSAGVGVGERQQVRDQGQVDGRQEVSQPLGDEGRVHLQGDRCRGGALGRAPHAL